MTAPNETTSSCGCSCESCARPTYPFHEFCTRAVGDPRCTRWKIQTDRPHIEREVCWARCLECGAKGPIPCGRWPLVVRHLASCSHGPEETVSEPAMGWVPDGHGGMIYTGPIGTVEASKGG